MPAPSWPSTTGNRPSGSSPDKVKASVWQTPVWVIFTSTSPALGGATSISTICRGWPGPKATAARDFMAWTPGWCDCGRPAAGRAGGLFQVGTDQRGHLGNAGVALRAGAGRLAELFADVRLHHPRHQAVDRAAHGG